MESLPTQLENPKGLHQRYYVQKIALLHGRFMLKEVDRDSEYFVLRLDTGGSDPEHIKACLIAVHAYADAIEHHLPELANDIRERYPLSVDAPKEMDWKEAKDYLDKIRKDYTEIGSVGLIALNIVINPLLIRYENGERSQLLHDEIMSLS